MKYRRSSHTKCKLEYHFFWVTKYRYKVLTGDVGLRVRELVRQSCEHLEIEILRGVISKDYVRLLVSAPPNIFSSDIMKRVKGRSSTKLFQEFPGLKKRYWGQHFWAREFFCVTAGELTTEMINEYLEHHFERKIEDNFDVE